MCVLMCVHMCVCFLPSLLLSSVGADPSVKVLYKPVRRYREESGILFSKNVVHTYTQVTDITNTRSDNTIITFLDQVPRSHDEKLKVNNKIKTFFPHQVTLLSSIR